MANTFFLKINKFLKISLIVFLFIPSSFINAVDFTSTSYTITDSDFNNNDQTSSTNFSVSGNLNQGLKGSFRSESLPLLPGTISSCGKITTAGTYTLSSNLIGISGPCFSIQANDVIIDGAGYSVIASNVNNSYAVVATSSSSAGSGYSTTTIQDITFSGFSGGINASGNNASSGNTAGGNGGSVVISSSTIGSVLTSGGQGFGSGSIGNGANIVINNSTTGNITNAGINGSIYISGADLDLSNKIYTTSGTFSFSYSGTLNKTNTTLSAIQHFIALGTDYGSYVGGGFPIFPTTITTCGSLYFSGTYTLGANISGNCNVLSTGVTIDGAGYTITGNVSANNHGVTLNNITVTGAVSTTGASAGTVTINNSSNLTGTISVTGSIAGDGTSSLGNTTINAGGSVSTSSVNFVADVINNGTINSGNSVIGKTTNNSIINTTTFTFNASSTNSGTVNGNAIFNASSTSTGTVTGNARFNSLSAITGSVSFGGTTAFIGTGYVNGNVYDSTGTDIISTWIFNASSTNTGILKGNAIFNDTSRNTISGSVQGNATFNDTSINLGTVTGDSLVYSPVVRPLTGTTDGQVIYYDYDGLYFSDTATGHGVTGKWDDINNWWTDAATTINSPIIPTEGDDVIILSSNIATTTTDAHVRTAIFQGSSDNGITLTVESTALDAALFNASSTNSGTIIGNATFSGADTENNGTVTGYITRQYNGGVYTVITDFTHNGVNWIIEAINGATVDLTGATYSLLTNIFKALNNAVFIWNNIIGSGTPNLEVTSPVTGTNIKWKPVISWDTDSLCQYKIDGGSYTSVVCSNDGSDIPRPAAGAHTIFFRSTDGENVMEKSVLFTYDNTQAVDTDCSSPLDEATRPYYYLTSNVGNCSITASTTLRGDNNGGGSFYTIGNITGNNNNVLLQNITATGTLSGFDNITVASSTLSGNIIISGTLESDSLSTFGNTTVNSGATVMSGTFTGNLVNNGTIANSTTTPITVLGNTTNNGIINNGFTFNASSTNAGTVNGTTTLNDASVNTGTVNGNLIFDTLTSVLSTVTFSDNTNFLGTGIVTGNVLDNRGDAITMWLFQDSSTNTGLVKGDSFFNDSTTNLGTISGNAHFSDLSVNSGVVTGNAYKYNSTYITSALTGTVNGNIIYHSYPNSASFRNISGDNDWNNISNWFAFSTSSLPLGRTPVSGENITLFASTTLKGNLTNNIFIAVSSSTLNGANYTLTGNISGNGAYGGHNAYNFNLDYITVTGTTTAIGGDGNPDVDGGRGGIINVQNSSTGVISVNGGDPIHNGGDAGAIYVYNTIAIAEGTLILAVGGDSVGCGFGGSGGNVSLVDSSGYVLVTDPGASATAMVSEGGNCVDVPVGNPGSAGQTSVTGVYNAPTTNTSNNAQTSIAAYYPSANVKIKKEVERIIPIINFTIKLSPFSIKSLPVFGDGTKDTFSFGAGIKNFFTISIPKDIIDDFKSAPTLLSFLGIKSVNDLMILKFKAIEIKNTKAPGLFTIYSSSSTSPLKSFINYDLKNSLYQSVKVGAGKKIIITLIPTGKDSSYKGKFGSKYVSFIDNKVEITTPSLSGTYTLTTEASPLPLKIQVIESHSQTGYSNIYHINTIVKIFNFVKNLFK